MNANTLPELLKVIYQAPEPNNAKHGLAVAIVAGDQVLLQISNALGSHSVLMESSAAVGLVMALCQHVRATDTDLARFRKLADSIWTEAPSAA